MNLDFSADQKAARDELCRVLAGRPGHLSARAALDGREAYDRVLWQQLGELGWLGVALPEAYGGQGLGQEMLCAVAEAIGGSLAAVPFVSSIVLCAETVAQIATPQQKLSLLPTLASGQRIAAFALAEKPGALTAASIGAHYANGVLHGSKIAVTHGMQADLLLVVARSGERFALCAVDAAAARVHRQSLTGVDPSEPPASLHFDGASAQQLGDPLSWSDIRSILDRAAVPVAFAQLGVADAALHMGRDYALTRKAFGRFIGSFQAIKHKLADIYIANELARANAYYAAWALQSGDAALPLAAATARVSATEALERAARDVILVHGGIGVTWQHDAHLFYRRAQHLGLMLGGLREWQDLLVSRLGVPARAVA
jgi:alkylation response protein AidB-like acyl-CoA dehydrogenase